MLSRITEIVSMMYMYILPSICVQVYERRSQVVKPKEAKNWKFITPEMMSEEEEDGDSFIRHRPSWRSSTLNRFLEKLENRYKSKHPKSLAKPRTYGDPVQKIPPSGAPLWMVSPEHSNEGLAAGSDHELFSEPNDSDHDSNGEETDPE